MMINFIIFLTIVTVVLFFVHVFLYKSHVKFLNISDSKIKTTIIVLYAFMFLTLFLTMGFSRKYHGDFANTVYYLVTLWLPVLNYVVIITLLNWLLYWLAIKFEISINWRLLHFISLGIVLLIMAWGITNYYNIKHKVVEIAIKNLPQQWETKKVILISDVHIGNYRDADYVRKTVELINAQKPDVLFIAGDLFDGGAFDVEKVSDELAKLQVNEKIFFVHGNHEHMTDSGIVALHEKKADFITLNNEVYLYDGVNIAGLRHQHIRRQGIFELLANSVKDKSKPIILLSHEPITNVSGLETINIDLQLAGHTHNGQFFPFNIVTTAIYGKMNYGLSDFGTFQSYTSSGLGIWGPAFRCMSRSEFVELKFTKAND